MMRKLALAALVTLPFVAGCYAEAYPPAYYPHHRSYVRAYGPRVYVAPAPVVVAPPPPRVYW